MPYLVNTWLFTLVINGKDVIPLGQFESGTVIEDAGSILPTFECKFSLKDTDLLQYLNEGNKIVLTIGRNFSECIRGNYVIHKVEQGYGGTGEVSVYVNGIYDAIPFLQNAKTKIFANKNSHEVMEEIGKENGFIIDNPIFGGYSSNDKMNWVQNGICDKKFFNNVWIHSYSQNDTPVVGITADGKMRIWSMKSLFSIPKIVFGSQMYYYDPNYQITQNTRWNNMNGGYGKVRVQDNIESGFGNLSLSDIVPVTDSGRGDLPRTAEAKPKMGQTKFTNENIHEHYWDAQSANISNLMAINNVSLTFTWKNFWNDIHVLDCIYFQDYMNAETNMVVSGKYVVTKVSRHIQNNQLMTLVQCARQNVNDPKGSFLTSLFNGGLGKAAENMIANVVDKATQAGTMVISSAINNGISQLTSGIANPNNMLSDIRSLLSSSLSLGEYSQALSSIASAISSPAGIGSMVLSQFPSISSITDRITEFVRFDSGVLLSNVFNANLGDILKNAQGVMTNFIGTNLNGIAGNVFKNFNFSLDGLIGGMNMAYRTAADSAVRSMIDQLKSAVIKI